ncbi:MAG TPA: hypothetical protein VFS05_02390 [Gemmatimonadaceae bacterium]|nr:hypothetical protein [Gemmatimonadaceae bacterium]
MSDATQYPTLAHAFAALDALPIAGSMQINRQRLGVDYDALTRARRLLPHVWSDGAVLTRIGMTMQGGITFAWQRAADTLELTIDPFSLYGLRLETPAKLVDWTRASLDHAVTDLRELFGLPPLARPAAAASTPAASARAQPARPGAAQAAR